MEIDSASMPAEGELDCVMLGDFHLIKLMNRMNLIGVHRKKRDVYLCRAFTHSRTLTNNKNELV